MQSLTAPLVGGIMRWRPVKERVAPPLANMTSAVHQWLLLTVQKIPRSPVLTNTLLSTGAAVTSHIVVTAGNLHLYSYIPNVTAQQPDEH